LKYRRAIGDPDDMRVQEDMSVVIQREKLVDGGRADGGGKGKGKGKKNANIDTQNTNDESDATGDANNDAIAEVDLTSSEKADPKNNKERKSKKSCLLCCGGCNFCACFSHPERTFGQKTKPTCWLPARNGRSVYRFGVIKQMMGAGFGA
jgi:hypothetical protein